MTTSVDTFLTIRQAGALFRCGRLSPVDLTVAVLDRIDKTEASLHAYVEILADWAMASAREAEAALYRGEDRGPLHGIPVAVKDIFDVEGVPTRCGSRARFDAPQAAEDAPSVARLREAGAIVIGKTVTQEFAAGVVSAPARNPWDPARIPGGSSGGSAAAVASASCLAALGYDTGGSVRIPASVTGIVGLKPTYGLIETRGVFPLSWSLDTVGPLARSVDDAALVLEALSRTPLDVASFEQETDGERHGDGRPLRGVRLGVSRPHFFDRIQPDVRATVDAAIGQMEGLGAEIIETPWAEAAAARAVAFLINRVETAAVHEEMVRTAPDRLALLGPDLRLRLEAGLLIPAAFYLRALRARRLVGVSIARLFATHRLDGLVVPTLPATAVAAEAAAIAHGDGEEPLATGYTRLTMPFNATGQPVLALPCGLDRVGMPIGLQIVGRPFRERALCRIGRAYERAAGWHQRRPPI